MDESTQLVGLCLDDYVCLASFFTLHDGQSMTVADLKDRTKEEWEFVGGDQKGLVARWLVENNLQRFLKGSVSPSVTKTF